MTNWLTSLSDAVLSFTLSSRGPLFFLFYLQTPSLCLQPSLLPPYLPPSVSNPVSIRPLFSLHRPLHSSDIDECGVVGQPCSPGFNCINTVGSYSCQRKIIMCSRGYHASPDGARCIGKRRRGIQICGVFISMVNTIVKSLIEMVDIEPQYPLCIFPLFLSTALPVSRCG